MRQVQSQADQYALAPHTAKGPEQRPGENANRAWERWLDEPDDWTHPDMDPPAAEFPGRHALHIAMADDEYQRHVADVHNKLDQMKDAGQDTRSMHGITGPTGATRWSPARRRQQNALLRDMYAQAANVPNEGRALMMGGLGGSGKGAVQRDPGLGLDTPNYLKIDPDDIKQQMAARGMTPQVEGLSPMETSPLVHEEASEMAHRLAHRAYHDKRNVLWDTTMHSDKSVADRMTDMRKAGYNQIDGALVDVDPVYARERADRRHRKGEESYREQGTGFGGRIVPHAVSASNAPTPGSGFQSNNAEVFDRAKPGFDNSIIYDNNAESQPTVRETNGNRWAGLRQIARRIRRYLS